MRNLLAGAVVTAALFATAPAAHAAPFVRDCVSFVTYDFSPPLTAAPGIGAVTIGGPTTCIVTHVSGLTYVQTYSSGSTVTYGGSCLGAVLTNVPGGGYVGTMAAQQATLTVNVLVSGAASANVAYAPVPTLSCAGVAQLNLVMRWVAVGT